MARAAAGDIPGPPVSGAARDEVTVTDAASNVVSTVPSWSVRKTRDECALSRAMVASLGCPYGLFAPTETAATPGCSVASSTSDDAVALP